MFLYLLSLPMRDSSLSLIVFVEDRDALMSCTQAVSFSLGKNARRERVWMSHPRQVLCSESWPFPDSLQSERGHPVSAVQMTVAA